MKASRRRQGRWTIGLVLGLLVAACGTGGDGAETTTGGAGGGDSTTSVETTAETDATTAPSDSTSAPADDATTTAASGELREIQLQLPNSSPSASAVSYYIAQDQGFYEENGLSVELLYGPGSGSALQQLVSGNALVASLSPTSIYLGTTEGADIVAIYNHFPENRFGVAVPVDSPIQSIEELEGLAVGISDAGGGEVPTVNAALSLAGFEPGVDVDVVPVGEGASAVLAVEEGEVAALGVSKPDVLVLELAGLETRMITQDPISQFPGDSLAVTREVLESERDMLVRLVRGTIQGKIWAQANPEATHAILKADYAPEQLADDAFGIPFVEASLRDTATPQGLEPEEHGKFIVENWQADVDLNVDVGVLSEPIDVNDILTNEIVEEAWAMGIDIEAITAAAQQAN